MSKTLFEAIDDLRRVQAVCKKLTDAGDVDELLQALEASKHTAAADTLRKFAVGAKRLIEHSNLEPLIAQLETIASTDQAATEASARLTKVQSELDAATKALETAKRDSADVALKIIERQDTLRGLQRDIADLMRRVEELPGPRKNLETEQGK